MAISGPNVFAFGTLLKDFRTRRRLTQQQLAQAISVHRSAVNRWEQGEFLPKQKGIVLELARCLKLDEQETRRLLEASLTAPAPHWRVPLQRNPFFTGREAILATLHRRLHTEKTVALTPTYALHGLGGIGKTQLALEYAYHHALEYCAVFWIAAETVESICSSLLCIAQILPMPERGDTDQQRIISALQQWLTTHGEWLLIWDNLEEMDLLTRFLPPVRHGAVLITTRAQALGTLARGIDVLPMQPEEAIWFLLRRAKVLEPDAPRERLCQFAESLPGEYAAAEQLVEVLGRLPLALDQAGAYLEETGCHLADYLRSYGQRPANLLARRGTPGTDHPQSVTATFRLLWQRARRAHPAAAELLCVCACLSPEAIPEELLVGDLASHVNPELASSELDQSLATLRTFSLVQRHPSTRTLSLHRLVQEVLLEEMSESDKATFQGRALHLLNTAFPDVPPGIHPELWEQCERLLPHVLAFAATIPESFEGQEQAEAFLNAAGYLYERSQYHQADQLCQRALRIVEHILGADHPQVARALHLLARLARNQGQYAQAERLFQRAVSLLEQALGLDHLQVASALNSQAITYAQQGKYKQAEPLYQRALHIREQLLGPEHPEVAASLNTLGILSRELGKYERAEQLYKRALRIWEQSLGAEHPQVALMLNNLANLYREQGRHEQAEPLCQHALDLLEHTVGLEYPDTAIPLDTLATIYREQGSYQQAGPLYQHALSLLERTVGPEHPRVVSPLTGLALLATAEGEYQAAKAWYERALRIQQQALDQGHPQIARILVGLANLYEQWRRDEQAEPLLMQACAILEARLGPEHPETLKAANAYECLVKCIRNASQEHDAQVTENMKLVHRRSRQNGTQLNALVGGRPATLPQGDDPLEPFLSMCCAQHPRAWCRSADLWHAYEIWAGIHQEPFPVTRYVFSAQLKAHGYHAARTKMARIWRGITLVNSVG